MTAIAGCPLLQRTGQCMGLLKQPAATSTDSLKFDKKSTPIMAKSTAALKNIHSKRRPSRRKITDVSPQHGIFTPFGPRKTGPLGGEEEANGSTLKGAPVSTKKLTPVSESCTCRSTPGAMALIGPWLLSFPATCRVGNR